MIMHTVCKAVRARRPAMNAAKSVGVQLSRA